MASNVTVEYDLGYPVRKVTVKTTPAMSLKAIVLEACDKLKLAHPESFGLKHGRNDLDLSLSVRFAYLAAGAKLSLVVCSAPVSQTVTIALQTEEHGRLIDKFSTDTSFWDILKHFERSKPGVELTVRTGIPSKDGLFAHLASLGKTPLYIMPVCVFMNKEYATIEDLMTVTLSQAGLSSGNGVIRLLFKHTKETLDSVQKKIQEVAQSLAVKLSTKEPVSVAPVVPESAQTSAPSAQVAVQNPSNGSHPVPNSNKVLSQSTEPGTEAVRQLNTPVKTPPPVISATPTAVPPTVETLDRQRALFRPPPDGHAMTRFELPDSFFELNPSEVKILLSETEARRKKAENAGFKTRALREQEDLERAQKYPKTCIRVRFPDRCSLQVNFLSSEQVSALYEQVQITLAEPNRPFTLYVTPPQRTLDPELSFYKSSLAPSSVVYLSWKDADASDVTYLNAEALALLQDYPLPPAMEVPDLAADAVLRDAASVRAQFEDDDNEPSRASRIVHIGSTGTQEGPSTPGSSSDTTTAKKLPKWLKLSK